MDSQIFTAVWAKELKITANIAQQCCESGTKCFTFGNLFNYHSNLIVLALLSLPVYLGENHTQRIKLPVQGNHTTEKLTEVIRCHDLHR